MKIHALVAALSAVGSDLSAVEFNNWARNTVTVCLENTASGNLSYASSLVSRIYAAIDIHIDWQQPRRCPTGAIHVSLQMFTLPSQFPGALAYALPYEGTHIVIFYDRVLETESRRVPKLTAHIMAHEIAHILEGTNLHSDSGVMKAKWDEKDLSEMAWKPLTFTNFDVRLIHRGLDDRANRLGIGRNLP